MSLRDKRLQSFAFLESLLLLMHAARRASRALHLADFNFGDFWQLRRFWQST
jgi:hypothetical protein